jgi:uncharacterized protein (TIGR02284 family)
MKAFILLFAIAFTSLSFAQKTASNQPSQLDDLIRGELAAVKSYDYAISKVKDENEKKQLEAMRNDHQNAVKTLKQYATSEVKEDAKDSGAWGTFAKSWTCAGSLFGDKNAMRALKQGEEHGVREYEEALEDATIQKELKQKIRADLLPKQRDHINKINSLL